MYNNYFIINVDYSALVVVVVVDSNAGVGPVGISLAEAAGTLSFNADACGFNDGDDDDAALLEDDGTDKVAGTTGETPFCRLRAAARSSKAFKASALFIDNSMSKTQKKSTFYQIV